MTQCHIIIIMASCHIIPRASMDQKLLDTLQNYDINIMFSRCALPPSRNLRWWSSSYSEPCPHFSSLSQAHFMRWILLLRFFFCCTFYTWACCNFEFLNIVRCDATKWIFIRITQYPCAGLKVLGLAMLHAVYLDLTQDPLCCMQCA